MNDKRKAEIGRRWAEILMLRRDREHKDRWRLTTGNKTDLGVFLTICRMVDDMRLNIVEEEDHEN